MSGEFRKPGQEIQTEAELPHEVVSQLRRLFFRSAEVHNQADMMGGVKSRNEKMQAIWKKLGFDIANFGSAKELGDKVWETAQNGEKLKTYLADLQSVRRKEEYKIFFLSHFVTRYRLEFLATKLMRKDQG